MNCGVIISLYELLYILYIHTIHTLYNIYYIQSKRNVVDGFKFKAHVKFAIQYLSLLFMLF